MDEKRGIVAVWNFPLLVAMLLASGSLAYSAPLVYVTNSTSNTVSVVDIGKGRVITEIPVGIEPFGLAFSPDGTRAYVANAKSTTVSVIDTARHQVIRSIGLGTRLPVWLAVSPDGSHIYVTNEGSHNVSVLATATHTEVGRIQVGRGPAGIVISPNGRFAYVANEGTHNVSLIDLQRREVILTIPVGSIPQGLAITPDGGYLYVANFGSDSVSVIETANNTVISEIPVQPVTSSPVKQGPVGIAISPDARWVYTGNFKAGSLSVIDTLSRKAVKSVPTGSETFGVAVEPRGAGIYVAAGKERQITVVDSLSLEVVRKISVGKGPFKLAVLPETRLSSELTALPETQISSKVQGLFLLGLSAGLAIVMFQATRCSRIQSKQTALLLGCIFLLALSLRLVGLNWGIPVYDAYTVSSAPSMRVSYHMDEDNFLWNLIRVRPEVFDLYVADFHWGTLQYYLVEFALLVSESMGLVSTPWRNSFLNVHPDEYARLFVSGRMVSALLGSCSIFLAYGIGQKLYGVPTGIWAGLVLSILPLHVMNSHYLTPDISMMFFLLFAFYGLLVTFDEASRRHYLWTGIVFGLAITAKYNAVFLLPVILLAHFLQRQHDWSRKAWCYVGMGIGFVLGEPYALVYRREFWGTLKRTYLTTAGLPEGSVPSLLELLGLQLKNMAFFGIGMPLATGLILLLAGYVCWRFSRFRSRASNSRFILNCLPLFFTRSTLIWATLFCFFISLMFVRQPMIRYTLPVVVFAAIPIGHLMNVLVHRNWGRVLAFCLVLLTGFFSYLQVKILSEEHTVNQAFQWIERHVPSGASLSKGWPEIPVLNSEKYRIRDFYTGDRMVDFKKYFSDKDGRPYYPDYVLLDNLATFDIPETFFQELARFYILVAEFKKNPQFWKLSFPEWNAPHDWKYSHPEIRIYRRKAIS